jgi:hypothetical protein
MSRQGDCLPKLRGRIGLEELRHLPILVPKCPTEETKIAYVDLHPRDATLALQITCSQSVWLHALSLASTISLNVRTTSSDEPVDLIKVKYLSTPCICPSSNLFDFHLWVLGTLEAPADSLAHLTRCPSSFDKAFVHVPLATSFVSVEILQWLAFQTYTSPSKEAGKAS